MEKHDNTNNFQDRKNDTDRKLEKMRQATYDKDKCKEIAQKLCAYISKNS